MKGPGGKGEGKPGRGKSKGKGKGKGKGCGAGVGSTYANPGRPKSFQPTQHDRLRTGNIAEYFLCKIFKRYRSSITLLHSTW